PLPKLFWFAAGSLAHIVLLRHQAASSGSSTPIRLAYAAGGEALWEGIWPGPAMKLVGPFAARSPEVRVGLALEIERHCSLDEILTRPPHRPCRLRGCRWRRLAFPSSLELNKLEGSFNPTALGNVISTTFFYVSRVQ